MTELRKPLLSLLIVTSLLLAACAGVSPAAESGAGNGDAMADDVPTVYIYNNSGTLQFDTGGSNPGCIATGTRITSPNSPAFARLPSCPLNRTGEQLNLLLGSSDPIDLFQTSSPGGWHDYRDAIIPLNELLEQHGQNLLSVIPKAEWEIMKDVDGNIMGIPRSTPTHPYVTWVRQDWLDELGLEVPATWEELEAVIDAFQAHQSRCLCGDPSWRYSLVYAGRLYPQWHVQLARYQRRPGQTVGHATGREGVGNRAQRLVGKGLFLRRHLYLF